MPIDKIQKPLLKDHFFFFLDPRLGDWFRRLPPGDGGGELLRAPRGHRDRGRGLRPHGAQARHPHPRQVDDQEPQLHQPLRHVAEVEVPDQREVELGARGHLHRRQVGERGQTG